MRQVDEVHGLPDHGAVDPSPPLLLQGDEGRQSPLTPRPSPKWLHWRYSRAGASPRRSSPACARSRSCSRWWQPASPRAGTAAGTPAQGHSMGTPGGTWLGWCSVERSSWLRVGREGEAFRPHLPKLMSKQLPINQQKPETSQQTPGVTPRPPKGTPVIAKRCPGITQRCTRDPGHHTETPRAVPMARAGSGPSLVPHSRAGHS